MPTGTDVPILWKQAGFSVSLRGHPDSGVFQSSPGERLEHWDSLGTGTVLPWPARVCKAT